MSKPRETTEYRLAYKALNKEQKLAVDTIEGPVMVVAGPGTGKTQTIALRIANIIKNTDLDPSSILALTFTESGARAMRERLSGLIGTPAYYVEINTFHGFCIKLIKDNPDKFFLDPSEEPLSDLEKLKIIYQLIDKGSLRLLKPLNSRYHYSKAVLGSISDLKREGVSPEQFSKLLDQEESFLSSAEGSELKKLERGSRLKNLQKNRELCGLYFSYQKILASFRRFDFDDMVNGVVKALMEDEELLLAYQEQYQYLLVDEYQDTNSAQNKLLLLLTSHWGGEANIMVTGDPDQAIMRFQGASIENQLSFMKNFPTAVVITLRLNYRSTQTILDAADSLISHNNLRIGDVVAGVANHLVSQSGKGVGISLATLSTGIAEAVFLAEDLKKQIERGVSPGELAVIYRNNVDSKIISDTLAKYGIDYLVQGGANVLEDPTVSNFLKILKVVHEIRDRKEDENLFTILHYSVFEINPLDVLKLSRLASENNLSLFDVLADSSLLDEIKLVSKDKLLSALSNLSSWSAFDAENSFTATFEEILNKSGYLKWVLGQVDSHHRLARLNTLFEEVKKMNRFDHELNLKTFLENIRLMEENNLRLEEDTFGVSSRAVTLTTAHKAKGLEWEHVYLYKGIDRVWGNNQNHNLLKLPGGILKHFHEEAKEKNEDERRLFYVAATRSKKSLTITRATSYNSGGRARESVPTMFIAELGDSRVRVVDVTQIETLAHAHLEKILSQKVPSVKVEETAYLEQLVGKLSLSVTSLNVFLECAYKFKLDKLFRVPHSKKPHLAFGSAVHKALENFYRQLKDEGITPGKDFLISEFIKALKSEVLSKQDYAERAEEGEKILSAYYDFNQKDFREPLFLEKFFRVKLNDLPSGQAGIDLNGKIDRIEMLSSRERTVRVVDYKTGKTKTMGQIVGQTQDSDGRLKRQLVFYKLLIDLDKRLNNLRLGEATLDFVSAPAEVEKDGKRSLPIRDEEVVELKKVIMESSKQIRSLHFPRTKDYKVCAKCDFLAHCYPEGLPSS